jgi:para-nitrobenzyl esterase
MADGKVLPMPPAEAFAEGLEAKIPYIVGWNSLEMPIPPAEVEKITASLAESDPRFSTIEAAYSDRDSYLTHIVSDLYFVEPALNLATMHATNGQPTWVYRFSVLSPAMRGLMQGAPHASERQYVFQTLGSSPWPTDANDAVQAKTISSFWVRFAKSGDPNGEGRPSWPRYDHSRDEILDFGNDGPSVIEPPRGKAMDAIADLYQGNTQ